MVNGLLPKGLYKVSNFIYHTTRKSARGTKMQTKKDVPNVLDLESYRRIVHLDDPYPLPNLSVVMKINEHDLKTLVGVLVAFLQSESQSDSFCQEFPKITLRQELYARLTLRPPKPLPNWFNEKMDILLQAELHYNGVVASKALFRKSQDNHFVLWQGDITTIQIDAIVNAANTQLLGCRVPFHKCIDNAIHAGAGPRLREDCAKIIQSQGFPEPTGQAKITRGYNLPSRFVLHTVGPIFSGSKKDYINGRVSPTQHKQLQSSYEKCLETASQLNQIRSIAFCGISTGVFGFPKSVAAQIATVTVTQWLKKHPNRFDMILFDVFSDEDREIYSQFLDQGTII